MTTTSESKSTETATPEVPEQAGKLTRILRDRKRANPQVEVNLRADRRADGKVVEALMAACAQVGISHVNLVAAMD